MCACVCVCALCGDLWMIMKPMVNFFFHSQFTRTKSSWTFFLATDYICQHTYMTHNTIYKHTLGHTTFMHTLTYHQAPPPPSFTLCNSEILSVHSQGFAFALCYGFIWIIRWTGFRWFNLQFARCGGSWLPRFRCTNAILALASERAVMILCSSLTLFYLLIFMSGAVIFAPTFIAIFFRLHLGWNYRLFLCLIRIVKITTFSFILYRKSGSALLYPIFARKFSIYSVFISFFLPRFL